MNKFLPGKLAAMAKHARASPTYPPDWDRSGTLFDKMRASLSPAGMSHGAKGPSDVSVAAGKATWGGLKKVREELFTQTSQFGVWDSRSQLWDSIFPLSGCGQGKTIGINVCNIVMLIIRFPDIPFFVSCGRGISDCIISLHISAWFCAFCLQGVEDVFERLPFMARWNKELQHMNKPSQGGWDALLANDIYVKGGGDHQGQGEVSSCSSVA